MFLVSDDILERLLCFHCKKYLNVKPIKVYPNRGIKCGRCSSENDAGVMSLFDLVAGEGLFRCINRYDGCNEVLTYTDVAEHEKNCTGGFYSCPLCVNFQDSAYNILQHYRTQHANNILLSPEFFVQLENESYDVYLYKKNDFLFFVYVKFSISEDDLTVRIEYIGSKESAKNIQLLVNIHSLEGPVQKKSRKTVCSAVAEEDPKMFKFRLQLNDFAKKIAICTLDLDTEAIENLIVVPKTSTKFSFGAQNAGATTGAKTFSFNNTAVESTTSSFSNNSTNAIPVTTKSSSSIIYPGSQPAVRGPFAQIMAPAGFTPILAPPKLNGLTIKEEKSKDTTNSATNPYSLFGATSSSGTPTDQSNWFGGRRNPDPLQPFGSSRQKSSLFANQLKKV